MTDVVSFDHFGLPEIPSFILCNPDGRELFSLGGISERTYSAKFNTLSEIKFKANEYVNEQKMPYYDLLTYRRLIHTDVSTIGYFMITKVVENGDGIEAYKEVTCQSVEVELVTKKIMLFKGQYPLTTSGSTTGLMDIITDNEGDYAPNWSYVLHDNVTSGCAIATKQRSFDVSDSNVYNFLTTEVSQAYVCVFVFDNENRVIHVHGLETLGTPTGIFISYDNVINSMSMEESTDNLATALSVVGGGGLEIYRVNPLGNNIIYDFTYFKTKDWMSQDLIDALDVWENNLIGSIPSYNLLVSDLAAINLNIQVTSGSISNDATQISVYTEQYNAAIAAGNTSLAAEITGSKVIVEQHKAALETDLSNLEVDRTMTINDMTMLNWMLSLNNTDNFTTQQFKTLQSFIIGSSYVNENFKKTDTMDDLAIQAEAQLLYEQGIQALARIREPRYVFKVDTANFMMIEAFSRFRNSFNLGSTITVEIKEGVYLNPFILQYDLDFDDPSNFSMVFGNRLHLDDDSFQYSDLMTQTIRAVATSQVNSVSWNENGRLASEINTFMSSPINATVNNIISGSSKTIVIDQAGITGRIASGSASFANEQLSITNMISFTDNSWNSAKIALGKLNVSSLDSTLPTAARGIISGSKVGVFGDYIVGHIMADNDLIITNSNGTVIVSGSSISIDMTTEDGLNRVILNSGSGLKIFRGTTPIFYLSSGSIYITAHVTAL